MTFMTQKKKLKFTQSNETLMREFGNGFCILFGQ